MVLAALAALGKGLAWLLNWHGERTDGKSARLQAWEDSLVEREKVYRLTIQTELGEVKAEVKLLRGHVGALGLSLYEVAAELRGHDPESAALAKAAAVLQRAFPPEFALPEDMADLARRFDPARKDES